MTVQFFLRRRWLGALITLTAFFALAAVPALRAQSGAGSIQGTVTDSTGAVIPGATVHVVNKGTGVASTTKTNSVGFYQVPGLLTGNYQVSVTATGMKTTTQTIELLVAQNAVVNAKLIPGAVTQQVQVSATAVQLITTDNGEITSTLENQRINQLPMNGRNIITLVNQTTPGLESCPESSSCANGQEGPSTEYETDGATITNREFGGVHQGANQMVDPDAVQEVRVMDEAAGAQYASPTTVILNTKSGTNELHGSLFETARNNAIGIARGRNNPSSYVAPQYIRNEFGGSVGGPVVIPGLYHGKNKTFFFFAYERYSLAQSPFQNEKVDTPQMVNGDFSQLTNGSGVLQTLYDPTTTGIYGQGKNACYGSTNPYCREAYTDEYSEGPGAGGAVANCNGDTNCMPISQQSALFKTLMAMQPNTTGKYGSLNPLISPDAANNYTGSVKELNTDPQFTWRLDQTFNENNKAYLRYTQNLTQSTSPRNDPNTASYTLPATAPGGAAIPALASGVSYTTSNVYAAALGYTHIFSPTFFSETVLSQSWYGEHNLAGGTPNADFEQELGLPNNFGAPGFPEIAGTFSEFGGTQFQYGVTTTTYNVDENFTKIFGKHQFLFGGRYRFEHIGSIPDEIKDTLEFGDYATALSNPSKFSSSSASANSNTGNANADAFMGAAYSYSNNIEPPYEHLHDMELDGYFQDNWRMRHNLTLNLGLRYEAHPAAWMGGGAMEGFDLKAYNPTTGVHGAIVLSGSPAQLESEKLTTQAVIQNDGLIGAMIETPAEAGLPSMLAYNYNLNFSPRIGVAWQPFGQWGAVIRGGIGRYYYPNPVREAYRLINRSNPLTAGYSENYTSANYTPHGGYMLLSKPNTSSNFTYNTTNPSTGLGGAGDNGFPIAGLNSANVVNSSSTTAITPGIGITNIDPRDPPSTVDEANFTIEQPLKWGSALRVSYIYTHGTNLNNSFYYNDHPSTYTWEIQQGAPTPANPGSGVSPYNSSTGMGPYDNLTYGSGNYQIQKTGWSNYNALQAEYEKLYHNGSAWQVMYVWSKSLRTGGDYGGENADDVEPYIDFDNQYLGTYAGAGANTVSVAAAPVSAPSSAPFNPTIPNALPIPPNLPPPPPASVQPWQYYKALNRWENYMVDTNTPPQHVQFNGIIDMPFGRGKRWMSGSNRVVNEMVGGWQVAGSGYFTVTDFAITNSNFGPTNPLKIYKKSKLIQDCTSGQCVNEYLWFNGYVAPTAVAGNTCSQGLSKVVNMPSDWQPYQTPLVQGCTTPSGGQTVTDKNYGTNDVALSGVTGSSYPGAKPQANGFVTAYSIQPSTANNGNSESAINVINPFAHTVLNGPMNWGADASLFKVFPITERVNLRVNVDAFNVFNNQGLGNPSATTGETCVQAGTSACSSHNTPRQLQFTARLNF